MALIGCEVKLDLKWSRNCVLIGKNYHITGAGFIITSTKLYVPVVFLYIKFLENIKEGFKRTISWNKYRPEITSQSKN